MAMHPQTWIKVNAPVDVGVAEIVSLLNTVDGLETLQSCQGIAGVEDGYVWFSCGDWKRMSEFIFAHVGPELKRRVDDDVTLMMEATSASEPLAKLSFRAEAADLVASALKDCVALAGGTVGASLLMTGDAQSLAIAE